MEPNKNQNCEKMKEEPIKEEENDLDYYNFTQDNTEIKIENNLENSLNSNIEIVIIIEPSNLIKEESLEKDPFKVKCSYCDQIFENNESLDERMKNHVGYKHKNQIPKVSDEKNTDEKTNEKRHDKVESNSEHRSKINVTPLGPSIQENRFKCTFCIVTFKYKDGMVKHKRQFHNEKFEEEQIAKKRKKDLENDSIAARKARNASARIKCDSCDEVFSRKDDVQNHIAEVHERKNQLIDDKAVHEGKKSKSNSKMQQNSEAKNNEMKCPVCLIVFDYKGTFERHLSNNHEFDCQFCKLRFVSSVNRRDHKTREHPNESGLKIKCPLCPEHFEAMLALKKHLKTYHKK